MASSIVKSAAQQVGNLLVEEGKFLYKVHDKIEKLQTELEWMECFLEDADNRQHQEKLVRKWVAQITNFAYEAEDIIERYLHEVSDQRGDGIWDTAKWISNILCTCRVSTLHNLGLDIDELIVEVSELNKRLKRYGIQFMRPTESLSYNAMMKEKRRIYPHIEEEAVGLEKDVQQVVAQVLNNQVNAVSIIGMGGLGKSTLARKVFVDKTIQEHFRNNCVWVYISKEFSRRNVFEEILIGLSVSSKGGDERKNIKELTDEELAKKIYELLQNMNCFVVLDDIWTTEAWDSLKPALGSITRSPPSKILLTTRNHVLLHHVDMNGYSHPLEPLNEENSWKLLQLKAFPQSRAGESSFSIDNQMGQDELQVDAEEKTKKEKLGRDMLKHCHGLPLAIIALGGILSSKKTLNEWEDVLNSISAYLMTSNGDGSRYGGILSVLELSYHDLPFYLKPCFLYLANFPEDYEISTERLYHLWEAEGILAISNKDDTQVQDVSMTFDVGERYLLELIQRSMVQVGKRWARNGRIKTCRVHDLMREVCIKNCKDVSFLTIREYPNFDLQSIIVDCCSMRKKIHRCVLHVKEGFVESHLSARHREKASDVRSLLIFLLKESYEVQFGRKDITNMVKCFPLLRVLDLQDTRIRSKTLELGDLIHLRYLSLKNVHIGELSPHFWDLKYLVTLDLRSLHLTELSNKFHQMERLRHLYLPNVFRVKHGVKLSFGVCRMETLKNFDPDCCEIKDLLQMTRLKIFSVRYLHEFKSGDDLKALAETPAIKSGHIVNSFGIEIKAVVIEEDPTILMSLFNESSCLLNKLHLKGEWGSMVAFHKVESAIESGIQVIPNSLRKLRILGCELGKQFILVLEKLPHLKELALTKVSTGNKISFSNGSFPHLKSLDLWSKDLEEWEVEEGALPSLQRLYIFGCDKLEKLPDGLPNSINIRCLNPCIKGIEKYNTCPDFKRDHGCG